MSRIRPGKTISLLLSLAIVIGSMPITAFAETPTEGTVTVPSLPGGKEETVNVTVTVTSNEETGATTTEKKTPDGGDTTDSGLNVNYEGSTVINGNHALVSDESHYTVSNSSGTYGAEGGSTTTVETRPITTPVDVPLTDDQTNDANKNTVTGNSAGTTTIISGNTIGGTYDCNSETVIEQGSVTTTTTDISITEVTDPSKNNLTQVVSSTVPTSDNDLLSAGLPVFGEGKDGYEYMYAGMGNISQFFTSYLYTTPEHEDDKPVYTADDGTPYYYHKQMGSPYADKYYVEGLYLNGEQVADTSNPFITNRSGTLQFVMYNPTTKTCSTVYCADLLTGANDGYYYNIVNLEDADYYTADEAAMIRTIAMNGYWGTTGTTESGVPVLGSLSAVQEMMKTATDKDGKRLFTDDEVSSLTDGVALTATQYAIWTYSNKVNNIEFVNAYFVNKDDANVMEGNCWNDIPVGKQSSVDLLFKLYNYLVNLTPSDAKQNTSDTIINQDNFLKDLSVTVVEKADHANNLDTDDTNDAYITNLTFALVVTPSTENGDDLVVKVIDKDGNTLASGRIAGELKDDETRLTADKNGNYTFSGITLIEGEQNFNITLEGIQNLEQGVYLYTSEIRNGAPSQTMVGIAEGERSVDVSMNVTFEFSADDEIVAKEHVWRSEWSSGGGSDPQPTPPLTETPPVDLDFEIPDSDVPLGNQVGAPDDKALDIPDEEVPLSSVPRTGDGSGLWLGLTALCACGLAALALTGRKREQA